MCVCLCLCVCVCVSVCVSACVCTGMCPPGEVINLIKVFSSYVVGARLAVKKEEKSGGGRWGELGKT